MTKQEFMAMSLPFSLKCLELQHRGDKNGEIGTFTGYELDMFSIIQDIRLPILRPLSDITKEIEYGGEKFVPTVNLGWNTVPLSFSASNIKMAVDTLTIHEAQKLIEWHFDIAGLIEKGEAIDINTLEENPYK